MGCGNSRFREKKLSNRALLLHKVYTAYQAYRTTDAFNFLVEAIECHMVLKHRWECILFCAVVKEHLTVLRNSLFNLKRIIEPTDPYKRNIRCQYINNVEEEFLFACKKSLKLIREYLIPTAKSNQDLISYYIIKGHIWRYASEHLLTGKKSQALKRARKSYEHAYLLGRWKLSAWNEIRILAKKSYDSFKYDARAEMNSLSMEQLALVLDRIHHNEEIIDVVEPDEHSQVVVVDMQEPRPGPSWAVD